MLRRTLPPPEPGPRLLPVLFGLVCLGFALGVGGKLLVTRLHQPVREGLATAPGERASFVPKPVLTSVRLPPIPTPQGTWYVVATPAREATPQPTPVFIHPQPSATPASPQPTRAVPVPQPTRPEQLRLPSPVATRPPTPAPTVAPTLAPTLPPPRPTLAPTPTVAKTASPVHLPAAQRVVRRYLQALIRGDETTATGLLAAGSGGLIEEAFLNRSARMTGLRSTPDTDGTTVHAEVMTAGGLYFVTYRVETRDGVLLITSHDYIKP